MIDGTQFTFHTPHPKTYLLGLPCWEVLINEKTGQKVNDMRTANIRGLDMKLKPSINGGYNLLINGSLHKYYNYGKQNADQFTFSKLVQSVDSITDILGINPDKCVLHGLEIGVNLPLSYSPAKVLKNLVCYRSRPFTQINKRSAYKGAQCALTQYTVKVYDKQKQSGIDCGNILRVEVSVSKMQAMTKYNIITLADLQNVDKVFPLVNILQEALNGIIWNDTAANLNRLSDRELKQWLFYSNPKSWQAMGKFKRNRANKAWEILLRKYGNPPNLLPLVLNTWKSLFNCEKEAQKPQPFYQLSNKSEAVETATFLPLECTVKRLHPNQVNSIYRNTENYYIENNNIISKENKKKEAKKLYCLSCGRNIEQQKKSSKFCSEKLYGRSAKKCRNKKSNLRRDMKIKVERAIKQNTFLAITYQDKTGNAYTDILHSTALASCYKSNRFN